MKALIQSVLFILSFVGVLLGMAYQLDRFNTELTKSMFNQPVRIEIALNK
jgi:hypothetical protein